MPTPPFAHLIDIDQARDRIRSFRGDLSTALTVVWRFAKEDCWIDSATGLEVDHLPG